MQTTEHPILFSAPMVRAILAGRKKQTRRILKTQPLPPVVRWDLRDGRFVPEALNDEVKQQFISTWPRHLECPYGKPADRLWVRETWQAWRCSSHECNEWNVCEGAPTEIPERYGDPTIEYAATSKSVGPWRPSIHMPRWASRITLEIESVRVERLQQISEEDALAEGCEAEHEQPYDYWEGYDTRGVDRYGNRLRHTMIPKENCPTPPEWMVEVKTHKGGRGSNISAVCNYKFLWESINGPGSWSKNPWVWVITFKRLTPALIQ